MNIIYFTTAINKNDFKDFIKLWKKPINPSNQNFHDKIIRSLSLTNHIDVISIRPFSKKLCNEKYLKSNEKTIGNITYHYLRVPRNKLMRPFSYANQLKILLKKINLSNALIISDTINPQAIRLATKAKKHTHLPLIGVCTDSPSNISNTSRSYTMYLLKKSRNLDGYISLTKSLNDLFNKANKPNIIVEGLVEDYFIKNKNEITINKPYFFFGGSLLEKYGVYNLIEAFKKLNRLDIALLISGHHANETKLLKEASGFDIRYLSLLPVSSVLNYEAYSIANINPRPFSEDLDRYSIPSKTLEYLSSGRPTISVKNSKLQKYFSNDAIWIKNNDPLEIKNALEKVLEMDEKDRIDLGKKAKEKVLNLYSLTSINKELDLFISNFKKR